MQDTTLLKPEMVHRIRCMSRIPFKAIITTNYNSVFNGVEVNVEPALCSGTINPCELFENILRGPSSHDHDGNLHDDKEEVPLQIPNPKPQTPNPKPQTPTRSCLAQGGIKTLRRTTSNPLIKRRR